MLTENRIFIQSHVNVPNILKLLNSQFQYVGLDYMPRNYDKEVPQNTEDYPIIILRLLQPE